MAKPKFGGDWTKHKLVLLEKYLAAYMRIFRSNQKARWFNTYYIDAFAGAGTIELPSQPGTAGQLSGTGRLDFDDGPSSNRMSPESEFLVGSVRRALGIEPPFKNYIFIEQKADRCRELELLKSEFPDRSINIYNTDANSYLRNWCRDIDLSKTRAVLFLDPYGMQVDWETLVAVAETHAIDTWLLFPIGGVIRHLTNKTPPDDEWSARLTRVFGTDSWRARFYPTISKQTLLGIEETQRKDADYDDVTNFVLERLETIFTGSCRKSTLL